MILITKILTQTTWTILEFPDILYTALVHDLSVVDYYSAKSKPGILFLNYFMASRCANYK